MFNVVRILRVKWYRQNNRGKKTLCTNRHQTIYLVIKKNLYQKNTHGPRYKQTIWPLVQDIIASCKMLSVKTRIERKLVEYRI